jgi:hypothetical protein
VFLAFDTASTITESVLQKAVADGVKAICVYLKYMTPAIVKLISDHGLQIITVFETTAERALSDTVGGTADGAAARDKAAAMGQPAGSAIYATADFDVVASQMSGVLRYCAAFKAALGDQARFGIYGNGALCQACLDQGIADFTWLAGGSGMTGTKAFATSGLATIIQDVGNKAGLNLGISIDSDRISAAEYGGWSLGTQPALPVSTPSASLADQAKLSIPAAISALQSLLKTAGFDPGDIDGKINTDIAKSATIKALVRYAVYAAGVN